MKQIILAILVTLGLSFAAFAQKSTTVAAFYKLKATSISGTEISMDSYKGKVILVVNTASKCGFTPQYEGLQLLYDKYKAQGLVVLGFPCNQFGSQEPGNADEIASFCSLKYKVDFPLFEKIDVNGKSAHPIFSFLKKELPGNRSNDIKWNFTKFLIDSSGKPYKRYASTTKPDEIALDIEKLLGIR